MKFFYLFCIGLSVTSSLFSQVGVNTKSPLGILHIDPKGDTSGTIVSTIQDSDDIIVDSDGNVGIGTVNPQAKLHIKTAGTADNPISGFRLEDGNQGGDKFLTIESSSNKASWRTLETNAAVNFDRPSSCPDLPLTNTSNYYKTNSSITLSKGCWVVMIAMLANMWGTTDSTGSFWLNTTLADATTVANSGQTLDKIVTPDIEGSQLVSLSGMMGYNTTGIVIGALIINTTKASQTYYYMAGGMTVNSTVTGAYFRYFGGIWGEDTIVAFRIPTDL